MKKPIFDSSALIRAFSLFAFVVLFSQTKAQIPDQPTNYITDHADLLSDKEEEQFNQILKAFEDSTTHQIFVLLTHSLEGMPIEDITIETATRWGVGQAGQDNGLLIAIYAADRQMRFEVGYGLEANLTDYETQIIQRDYMIPFLKTGDYYGAVSAGISHSIEEISTAPQAKSTYSYRSNYYQPVNEFWPPLTFQNDTWYINFFWLFGGILLLVILTHFLIGLIFRTAGKFFENPWVRRGVHWGVNGVVIGLIVFMANPDYYVQVTPSFGGFPIGALLLMVSFFLLTTLGSWIDMAAEIYYKKPKKKNSWRNSLRKKKRKTTYTAFGVFKKIFIYIANLFYTLIIWAQFGLIGMVIYSEVESFGIFLSILFTDAALSFMMFIFYQAFSGNLESSGGSGGYSGSSSSYSSSSWGGSSSFSSGSSFGGGGGGSFGGGGSSSSW